MDNELDRWTTYGGHGWTVDFGTYLELGGRGIGRARGRC